MHWLHWVLTQVAFGIGLKSQFFFLLFSLFLQLFMGPLHFFVLFMSLNVLFQLSFNFIYNNFNKSFHFQLNKLFPNGLLDFSFILFNNPLFVRDRAPSSFLVLGQTHVYGWNRVITSVDPTFCTPYDSSPYSLMMLKL